MYFLRSWLQDYIDLSQQNSNELLEKITRQSGEVEEIIQTQDYFDSKVVIGQVVNLKKHPNADRINQFQVDVGYAKFNLLSAAPNVVENMFLPLALSGCRLGHITIQDRKIRGEISQGMCLSKSELFLENEISQGLWNLENNLKQAGFSLENLESKKQILGQPIFKIFPELFPLEEIWDIKYLADKFSSCGSHLGLALEIAVILKQPELLSPLAANLKNPKKLIQSFNFEEKLSNKSNLEVNFEDKTTVAKAFFLLELNFKKQFYLPANLAKRMFLTQENLIGGPADLSNYLLRDMGQPTHFFSRNKILTDQKKSLNLKIDTVKEKTIFEGLGQLKSAEIPSETIVLKKVEDQNKTPLILPGISGSKSSKTDENETQVLLEIANFDPEKVSQQTHLLSYRSLASRFWSSGVKPSLIFVAILRLCQILEDHQINFELKPVLNWIENEIIKKHDLHPTQIFHPGNLIRFLQIQFENSKIKLDLDYVADRISNSQSHSLLKQVEQNLEQVGTLENGYFYPNIFYSNLRMVDDLVFEAARILDVNILPNEALTSELKPVKNDLFNLEIELKKLAQEYGFTEIKSRPILNQKKQAKFPKTFSSNYHALNLLHQKNDQARTLQTSLLPNLLTVLAKNLKNGVKNLNFVETNRVYLKDSETNKIQQNWHFDLISQSNDPYHLTSFVRDFFYKIGLEFDYQKNPNSNFKDYGEVIKYQAINKQISNDSVINLQDENFFTNSNLEVYLIQIKNQVKKLVGLPLKNPVWYLHLNLPFDLNFNPYKTYSSRSDFSSLHRTYSFEVSSEAKWQTVQEIIKSVSVDFEIKLNPLERLHLEQLEILNFEIEYFSFDRTLNKTEIEKFETDMQDKLTSTLPTFKRR